MTSFGVKCRNARLSQ